MATPSRTSGPPPEPPRHSSAARLWGAIVAPGQTFAELAQDPHFMLCIGVQAVVAAGVWTFILRRMGAVAMARQALMQSGRAQTMDPAALQRALAVTARVYQFMPGLLLVFAILGPLLLGWIVQGVANALLGRNARYKQALALTSYALLPATIRGLLIALVFALSAAPAQFNYVNPLGDNVGYFLDRAAVGPFFYALGTRLNLFSLWVLVLLALGIARLDSRKKSLTGPFWALLSLWLFFILAASALAALQA